MKNKSTIRDVAKLAGVSSATVSYVLNGVKKVSDDTKQRVLKSVEELNYYPDFTAISLSKSKSNLIGVMVPLITDSPASMFKKNQYYHEFLSGVEMIARNNNFDTMISGVGDPEECSNWVKKRNLDGLIFVGLFPENLYLEMSKLDIPIVLIDSYEEHANRYLNVQIDDELGGYAATRHLIELGHEKIVFVATSLASSPVDRKRYDGYKRAITEFHLPLDDRLTIETNDIAFDYGYKAGESIVRSSVHCTAVVAVSDNLAIGIIKALQDNGKRIPEDYSIVGFDDIAISQYITPSLTTVRQDVFDKGKTATELLMKSINDTDAPSPSGTTAVELPIKLIIRDSTKAL
ncbi:LacI family DNA-binding transcriptional regulator [Jeotgalibacillus proteolyticus]|uniref:LacI family transcriptional regulator n=1 Tax=Jeotgalibacillus proteolyticus TaxID=2082395 RepID=A0A2S5GDT2_9BACL|nr:LacI family DNA-binding transcriptional regulator [Jeotgalibacillus proteolyticus]PPA71071.1 LacI family transcriptional regulator [Jeotgalibacillus proteolyticus]